MPPTTVNALTTLALEVFHASMLPSAPDSPGGRGLGDNVLDSAPDVNQYMQSLSEGALRSAAQSLREDPALEELAHRENENDPIFVTKGGSSRLSTETALYAIFTGALRRTYFQGQTLTEDGLKCLVIENYDALKRAVLGDEVTTYAVLGLTGVRLPRSSQIQTPWGVIYPSPDLSHHRHQARTFLAETTAVLMRPRRTRYVISREDSPDWPGGREDYFAPERRAADLLPLAFALATGEKSRCAPRITFTTDVEPFIPGSASTLRPWPYRPDGAVITDEEIPVIEEWSRVVENEHVESLRVAATRLVSAVGERLDRADSLIDAVTVWEALVGTDTETTFRVTAALAKLLEPEAAERLVLRKKLAEIYGTRSRVVHGAVVKASRIDQHAKEAVDFASAAMREIYGRGGDWLVLESVDRGNRLILAE